MFIKVLIDSFQKSSITLTKGKNSNFEIKQQEIIQLIIQLIIIHSHFYELVLVKELILKKWWLIDFKLGLVPCQRRNNTVHLNSLNTAWLFMWLFWHKTFEFPSLHSNQAYPVHYQTKEPRDGCEMIFEWLKSIWGPWECRIILWVSRFLFFFT